MPKQFHILSAVVIQVIERLGAIGTISYVGAMLLFITTFTVDFKQEAIKGVTLAIIGALLLAYSGLVYYLEAKEETLKTKEALGVLREVYNRAAEQISTSDKDKTVSITTTINNLPDKIAELVKKLQKK